MRMVQNNVLRELTMMAKYEKNTTVMKNTANNLPLERTNCSTFNHQRWHLFYFYYIKNAKNTLTNI